MFQGLETNVTAASGEARIAKMPTGKLQVLVRRRLHQRLRSAARGKKKGERERVGDCDVSLWVYIILGRRVYKNLCPPYGQDAFFVHTRNIQNIVFL